MGDRTRWWFLAGCAAALLASPALADDWPQWLGPQRDGVWRETGIVETLPEGGPKVVWRAKVAAGYTGPAVAGGRVYLMDRQLAPGAKNHNEAMFPHRPGKGIPGNERVLCLNAADGKLLWKHEYDCPYTVSYPAGPRATPVVRDGRVYTLGTEGHLLCLDATTGKVAWQRDFTKEYEVKAPLWGHSAHPLLDGQKLICMVGGDGTTVVAFDKDTGKELWRALSAKGPGYCPPMIYQAGGKRQLIVWHAEAVCGLDPETGQEYWSVPAATYQEMSIATPRKDGELLFVTAYPSTAVMIKLAGDRPSAEVAWKGAPTKKTGFFTVFSTPFFQDGHLYGISSGGVLTCIKADTGERLWQTSQPHGPKPEGSAEVFLVKNGDRWFLANEKGDLIIAKLSPKGYEDVSRAHLLKPTGAAFGRMVLWSHPAYANRCMFWRNDEELICVSLAADATQP
jgi:outer membrane protein assembly factor BamB